MSGLQELVAECGGKLAETFWLNSREPIRYCPLGKQKCGYQERQRIKVPEEAHGTVKFMRYRRCGYEGGMEKCLTGQ